MPDVQNGNTDPFAAAAWISHVFVSIHPFEVSRSQTLSEKDKLMHNVNPKLGRQRATF